MTDWQPSANLERLRARARILGQIRAFFAARGVLEVETPLLALGTVTDPHIDGVPVTLDGRPLFLQTSPEFAMKRLLAAGSGSIYQITHAFRGGELGQLHNSEFTILEWYRVGWTHVDLMGDVEALLVDVLGSASAERISYGEAFQRELSLDPHLASAAEFQAAAKLRGIEARGLDRQGWRQLLLATCVEPRLGEERPTFLFDFPADEAALARIRPGTPPVAERFEVYVRGVELANGYHELLDADEQECRFAADAARRRELGLASREPDRRLLAALRVGLPPCAGVALGLDRLVLLATGATHLADVLAFPIDRA